MKIPSRMLAFTVASLLAATAFAQDAGAPPPPPPPPPAQVAPPAPPAAPAEPMQPMSQQGAMPAASGSLTDVHSAQIGPSITVNSGMPAGDDYGPKPPFAQLANGKKCISHDAAQAYLPLYNDWLHAAGHGNCISKSQYERWQ